MPLVELSYQVSPNGSLTLPTDDIHEMGLLPGDTITAAYLSSNGIINDSSEFLISGLSPTIGPQEIILPSALLQDAGIPPSADVNIACADGAIIIYAAELLSIAELDVVLEQLHIAGDQILSLIKNDEKLSDA